MSATPQEQPASEIEIRTAYAAEDLDTGSQAMTDTRYGLLWIEEEGGRYSFYSRGQVLKENLEKPAAIKFLADAYISDKSEIGSRLE